MTACTQSLKLTSDGAYYSHSQSTYNATVTIVGTVYLIHGNNGNGKKGN